MCASPLSPRHAQPDWMGGGLVSRQMMHAPPSAAIFTGLLAFGSAQLSAQAEGEVDTKSVNTHGEYQSILRNS